MPVYASFAFVLSLLIVVEGSTTPLNSQHVLFDTAHHPNVNSIKIQTSNSGQDLDTAAKDVNEFEAPAASCTCARRERAIIGESEKNVTCSSPWLIPKHNSNGSIACECGSSLEGAVECNNATQQVIVLKCFCITYSTGKNDLIVGRCFYGCFIERTAITCNSVFYLPLPYYSLPSKASQLNQVCDPFHRSGQLCGKCKDGFTPPVYSYNSSCVNCTEYSSNWAKYITVSFLPLTAFFVVVVIFRVSATSGLLNVFVFVCQTVTTPAVARVFAFSTIGGQKTRIRLLSYIGLSVYGIWNLDFFRLLYSPFCLHPEMTTLQTLALDYAIAVYPLLLIVITYVLVEMHDHNFRILVWLWKPFHACFVHFRKEWNIRGSMINAFATFLLLSYVKFLSVSFDLLIPVRVFDIHGKALSKLYLYFDGTVEYFGQEHLPFAILAIVVLVVFNIFPLLLLTFYPCRCFQRFLNYYHIHYQVLNILMDTFQGSYKDGSNGTRDCRWFAALYLVVRITFLLALALVTSEIVLTVGIIIVLVPVFLTAVFHPHKSLFYNIVDIFLLLVLVSFFTSITSVALSHYYTIPSAKISDILTAIVSPTPLLYLIIVLLYKLLAHTKFIQSACQKTCMLIRCHFQEANQTILEESLPHRIIHANEYTPLLLTEPTEHTVPEQDSEHVSCTY